jgi:hypothetical protein
MFLDVFAGSGRPDKFVVTIMKKVSKTLQKQDKEETCDTKLASRLVWW